MNTLEEYMTEKHRTLGNDYRTPDGRYSESCSEIAWEIARMLHKRREEPYIAEVFKLAGDGNFDIIIPKLFSGRVKWGRHVICGADDSVYDPMVSPKPIHIKEYLPKAFLGEVKTNIFVSRKEIGRLLRRA